MAKPSSSVELSLSLDRNLFLSDSVGSLELLLTDKVMSQCLGTLTVSFSSSKHSGSNLSMSNSEKFLKRSSADAQNREILAAKRKRQLPEILSPSIPVINGVESITPKVESAETEAGETEDTAIVKADYDWGSDSIINLAKSLNEEEEGETLESAESASNSIVWPDLNSSYDSSTSSLDNLSSASLLDAGSSQLVPQFGHRIDYRTSKALSSSQPGEVMHCSMCAYCTTKRSLLMSHLRNAHSNARPYACALCPFACKTKSNLTQHYRSSHKLNEEDTRALARTRKYSRKQRNLNGSSSTDNSL